MSLSGFGGQPKATSWPASPVTPEVRQHIRPRDQNGKGGHLAKLVSCGVSPTKSPRLRPRPLPSSHTRGLCLAWRGITMQVSRSWDSLYQGLCLSHRRRDPNAPRSWRWSLGTGLAAGRGTPVCVSVHTAYRLLPSLEGPQWIPRRNQNRSPPAVPQPDPQILSTLTERQRSENTKGCRPRPAPPPSRSPALANGPDSSQELGGWAGASPTCGADACPPRPSPRPSPRRHQTARPGRGMGIGAWASGWARCLPGSGGGAGRGEGGLNHSV